MRERIDALIVEDSVDDAELAVRALRSAGLDLRHVRVETLDALESALRERPWDLVISDFSLPQMNATAALETVRKIDPDVPFIIVSGTIGEERAVAAMRAGAQDYILKGDGLERLAPAVEREVREGDLRRRQRQEEEARLRAEEKARVLAAIVESAADAMISMTLDGKILSWNRGAETCFGHAADEIIGQDVLRVFSLERTGEMSEALQRVRQGVSLTDHETVGAHKEGTTLDVSVTLSPIYDGEHERIVAASAVLRDITERKQTESRLAFVADHDLLTKLFNRRRFDEELTREISLARRYGTGGTAMVIGLDNFKFVNDAFGHQVGDALIRRVAELLPAVLSDVDTIARIGGDEFAVFLRDEDPGTVARRVLAALKERPLLASPQPLRMTASIGISPLAEHDLSSEELLTRANLAMYEAKDQGGDCWRKFEPELRRREQMGERLRMADRVRDAIAGGSFVAHCQPILDLGANSVSQYELLVRMIDENGGTVAPGDFLPIAERFGLIEQIDEWMVMRAIDLLETRGRGRDIRIEVNLSAQSMVNAALFDRIEERIRSSAIEASQLIFEVTETTAIENLNEARQLSGRLIELGCRFALDDFGAGFGSFYYLKHLPFDYLKIDGDFIRRLPTNLTDQSMVEATVQICHQLEKRVIAEFVEDQETLELLRRYRVDYAQGFHIGRPAPLEQIEWGARN